MLFNSIAVANMVRENKSYPIDSILQSADPASGMQSFDRCLFRYVREHLVDPLEAIHHSTYPTVLRQSLFDAGLMPET